MSVLGTIPKPGTEDYRPRIERGEVWILEIEGERTGIAVLEGNTEYLLIYSIAVKPDAQRKGYGRALLDFADKRAIELGLHEVRLYTNEKMERNLTLYRGHGFVQVGKRPHPTRTSARRHGSKIAFAPIALVFPICHVPGVGTGVAPGRYGQRKRSIKGPFLMAGGGFPRLGILNARGRSYSNRAARR